VTDQLSSDLAALRIQRDVHPARRGVGRVVVGIVVAAGLAVGGVVGYRRLASAVFKTEIVMTEVALVSPAQASISVTATGYVVPQSIARPGAKVAGRLSKVRVKEGDVVNAGDVLVELDDADQRASIVSAEARIASARAKVASARANAAELRPQITREQILVDKGANARATLEDLTARAAALDEAARAAEAEVHAAEAEANALRVNLRDNIVVSPIHGTVITKPPEVFDLVAPPAFIVEIADFDSLEVEVDVPESRLNLVHVGTPCEIVLDAEPSRRRAGTAVELSTRVNRAKATLIVKVKFDEGTAGVLPDMAARVSFLTKRVDAESMKVPPKRVVPKSAVVDRGGSKVVFVVDEGKARLTKVVLGPAVGDGYEMLEGPLPTTRIVQSPAPDLADGQRVKEKERAD
jgi:RND family efflux transporter MFP subunit